MAEKVLSLETSGMSGEVALLEGDTLVYESQVRPDERTAKYLSARIDESLNAVGWQPTEVDLVAVTQGPGSFTGLRVGVTTAKVFAYATNAGVVGVNCLQAVAAQVSVNEPTTVAAVMDAHRQEVFAARFQVAEDTIPELLDTPAPISIDEWIQARLADKSHTVVSGPVLGKISDRLGDELTLADSESWTLRASTIGRLGLAIHKAGHSDDFWGLVPEYYRKSAAEEKAAGGN
ncbi:MAG: tRNA (adenosine(37)-N6)-threonylcarbamoyltransferase complex dimerization subunit type 1 TsaB [Planctomycetota bacterium]